MSALTEMQKRYIWLAGSFPELPVRQGRGYRQEMTLFGRDQGTLIIFGYSSPLVPLTRRGLFTKADNSPDHFLTEAGRRVFRRLLAGGAGMKLNASIKECALAPLPKSSDGSPT